MLEFTQEVEILYKNTIALFPELEAKINAAELKEIHRRAEHKQYMKERRDNEKRTIRENNKD